MHYVIQTLCRNDQNFIGYIFKDFIFLGPKPVPVTVYFYLCSVYLDKYTN